MSNPINGWTAAVQNFGAQATNVAGQTQSIFSSAFETLTSGISGEHHQPELLAEYARRPRERGSEEHHRRLREDGCPVGRECGAMP
ncbi:phage tail tape measure C-terminal domain-containing protein [Pseudomonas aeruginosa]